MIVGEGQYRYEVQADWEQLPDGWVHGDVAGIATDSQDRVYVHPSRRPVQPPDAPRRRPERRHLRLGRLRQRPHPPLLTINVGDVTKTSLSRFGTWRGDCHTVQKFARV
jgi:hypothetical protein